ncbi:MAG: 16S rRNA (cytosine(1402)-N(4))-methyltransferase RsmH [Oscillospiraceae bacterium]|nr:16S rRNA (cytosine(1402)-N(4))-methyltransferase RsmH [Oscillospiraceae bacterium]
MKFTHYPVMLNEVIENLNVKKDGLYVDGTLGGGGHALEICKAGGKLIGIDRDKTALEAANERLKEYQPELVHSNFADITEILKERKIDGAILDLGVSSHQLDEISRGFSYHSEATLDMRMDTTQELTAEIVVNTYSEKELAKIIKEYGEERFAKSIARNIVKNRPIKTTTELSEIIKKSIPARIRFADKHPAKRTFQAIRIEVNSELSSIKMAIKDFAAHLAPGGRLCIISFHSLEDRIVKEEFARLAKPRCTCPPSLPICGCNALAPEFKLITKKPITPSPTELSQNPRSHSAKLRVLEKLH